jgi:hypothetical protein
MLGTGAMLGTAAMFGAGTTFGTDTVSARLVAGGPSLRASSAPESFA